MANITVELNLSRSTPGTHLYKTSDPTLAIQNLYIRKHVLPTPPPTKIRVTVEVAG